jgi:hypothetical protein
MTLAFTLSTFSAAGGTSTTFVGLATTATSLVAGTNYQVNSLGIGTAASGVAGEVRAAGNITGFYSSDAKFKENIQTIPNALEAVVAIGGKTFDWTEEYIRHHGGADGYFVRKNDFGVIAQDAQKHFPLAVRTRPDGSLAVDYEKLCALAFAAIAELNQQVIELQTQLGNR